jgi:magnesium chelatase family protein
MLDRFDIHAEAAAVEFEDLSSKRKAEPSAAIRERVQAARDIQTKRFSGTGITCNAKITPDLMSEVCRMTDEATGVLKTVFESFGLSARAYDKILKVARTAADLDGAEIIGSQHIMEAASYRTLDRKYWT